MATSYQTNPESKSEMPEAFEQMKSKAEEGTGRLASGTQQTAEDVYVATQRFVREQPLLALGITAGLAFAFGALWRNSSSHNRHSLVERVSDYLEPQYRALRRRL